MREYVLVKITIAVIAEVLKEKDLITLIARLDREAVCPVAMEAGRHGVAS